ncbi:MAG: hypothetical protein J6W05_04600 [Prevotella sp.]|nr:hypothetical protein [Prevotella sp.]
MREPLKDKNRLEHDSRGDRYLSHRSHHTQVPVPVTKGKWMISEIDGEDAVTNLKTVYDFESLTKVYMSASLNSQPEMQSFWKEKFELTAVIDDNHIALAGQKDDKTAVLDEFIVSYITADVMQCVLLHSEINDKGEMTTSPALFCTFEKVDKDYSADIIGMWEGQVTSEQDTYGDGLQHRWEYKADGTTFTSTFEMKKVTE